MKYLVPTYTKLITYDNPSVKLDEKSSLIE